MVEDLAGVVRALIHAPEEIREPFRFPRLHPSRGVVRVHIPLRDRTSGWSSDPGTRPSGGGGAFGDSEAGIRREDVVVGVPDPELVPFVERALSGVDVPHRFAGGTPLAAYGTGSPSPGPDRVCRRSAFPAFAALAPPPRSPRDGGGGGGREGAAASRGGETPGILGSHRCPHRRGPVPEQAPSGLGEGTPSRGG